MTTHNIITLSDTTATRLTPNGMHTGMDITIQNINEEAYVYLGAEGVTSTSYGYRLAPSAGWSIELPGVDSLYAISDTNESTIAVLQTGLESGS